MDHRRLQRSLFRTLHDPGFAARLQAGEPDATASTGLGETELALLRSADPAALGADRGARRALQLVESVGGEFGLCTHPAVARSLPPDWPHGFASSPEFHAAVSDAGSLALAFGAFAIRRAREAGSLALAALAELERELARARRRAASAAAAAPGHVVRAPDVCLVALPEGAFALATSLRAALDAGAAPALSALRAFQPEATECVLVQALPRSNPHALREVRAERLEPLVAAFLRAAEAPLDPSARAAFAAAHALSPAEVEAVVDDFVGDGVLLRG